MSQVSHLRSQIVIGLVSNQYLNGTRLAHAHLHVLSLTRASHHRCMQTACFISDARVFHHRYMQMACSIARCMQIVYSCTARTHASCRLSVRSIEGGGRALRVRSRLSRSLRLDPPTCVLGQCFVPLRHSMNAPRAVLYHCVLSLPAPGTVRAHGSHPGVILCTVFRL